MEDIKIQSVLSEKMKRGNKTLKVNDVLRDEFEFRCISLKKFAKEYGIKYRTLISYVSKEGIVPSSENLYKIAKGLGVTMEYLWTGDPKSNYLANKDVLVSKLVDLPTSLYRQVISLINTLYSYEKEIEKSNKSIYNIF